jgi:transcriptional regulator GlxA family with amidase domain
MHQTPGEDWTLQRMAEIAAMSRSTFADAFKKATGTTPAAYLTTWRLTLAASMLRAGRPAHVIATDLGFASTSSLSKAFRQLFGLSPRPWLAVTDRDGGGAGAAGELLSVSRVPRMASSSP